MLCKLMRGSRYGELVHLPKSQETQLAIMLGDIEVVDAPIDPIDTARMQHPPKGWSIIHGSPHGDGADALKPIIRFDDGNGHHILLERVPEPVRRWIPPAAGEAEGHYGMVAPIEIPQAVLDEFKRLGGGPRDEEAEFAVAELRRQQLMRQQAETDRQNALTSVEIVAAGYRRK